MEEFSCRICGCNSYFYFDDINCYVCEECGIMFSNPSLFGIYSLKRRFEVVDNEYRKHENSVSFPTRATSKSAGYDFYTPIEFKIEPGGDYKLWTDIKVCMLKDEFLFIDNRSSVSNKHDVIIKNIIPIIDSDYYNNKDTGGNIQIRFKNNSNKLFKFEKNDKIAQGIFMKYLLVDNDNPLFDERTGGIGSTGR